MSALAEQIDARREEILDRWAMKLRAEVVPKVLPRSELIDHMPDVLDFMVALLRGRVSRDDGASIARERAAQRLSEGFSTDQVVREYGLLYDTIAEVTKDPERRSSDGDLHVLAQAFIDAIAQCAAEYSRRKRAKLRRSDTLFQLLFESSPDPYVVVAPDLTIVAANDAYLRATHTLREGILGEPFFDVFPENPREPGAAPRELRASFERVVLHRCTDELPVHRYDIRRDDGQFEERYWKPLSIPVLTATGEVDVILHRVVDVTEARQRESALAGASSALAERIRVLQAILSAAGEAILVIEPGTRHVVYNDVARNLMGPALLAPTEGWSRRLGLYQPDQVTRLTDEEMPLERALRGIEITDQELWVHNSTVPEGRAVRAAARPLRDEQGNPVGAVATFTDITDLKQAQHQLADLAVTDELTGLPNRRAFRQRLDILVAEAARGRQFAVTLVDIDHFKRVNDTHGHAVGDRALIAVAQTLRRQARRVDFVARYGGEEFCVISVDVDRDHAGWLAERMRAAIASIELPLPMTCSFGVSHSSSTDDGNELLVLADEALYQAKRDGRDRVVVHEAPVRQAAAGGTRSS